MSIKPRALGKGIEALLQEEEVPIGTSTNEILSVSVNNIEANPEQPRKHFDEDSLTELADSIRINGIIQPILVEEVSPGRYMIIAGERRFRAAKRASLNEVPVIVRAFTPAEKLEIALIENIQRENLNPIEEARAYRGLMDLLQCSQEEVATKVGKKRSTIANAIRLLKLPREILDSLEKDELSPGHARAILAVVNPADQQILFGRILSQGLSVREAEALALELNNGNRSSAQSQKKKPAEHKVDHDLSRLEQRLIDALGTKVTLSGNVKKGKVVIEYYSMDDLERVLDIIAKE